MSGSAAETLRDAERVLSALAGVVADLSVSARSVHAKLPPLHPEEAAMLSPRAVEKRRREFHAGRTAARDALSELGHAQAVLPRHDNGAAIWPDGITGSISHTSDVALAACRASDKPIGLDLEFNESLSPDVANVVSSAVERAAFPTEPAPERIVFSAKESVYKCIAAQVGRVVGFDEVSITATATPNGFTAVALSDLSGRAKPGQIVAQGYVFTSGRHILTFAESRL